MVARTRFERWALAATLFGGPISAKIAERTLVTFEGAGIHSLAAGRRLETARLVELFDVGGYARYDFQTAGRLQVIAVALETNHGGRVSAALGGSSDVLEAALTALPGWGPATGALFLRELRACTTGSARRIDARAQQADEHLGLLGPDGRGALARWRELAGKAAQIDIRAAHSAPGSRARNSAR